MSRSWPGRWGYPCSAAVKDVRRTIVDGDYLLLDSSTGSVVVRPNASMEEAFDAKLVVSQKRRAEFAAMRDCRRKRSMGSVSN